jgi:alpha-N-arabinofuranosidase
MGQSAMIFENRIKLTADQIDIARAMKGFKNPVYISVDEWGSFGRSFRNVLPVAQCLNSFIRHADIVKMANFTILTSLLSNDNKKGTYKSPLFYTFKLFSNNCLGNTIDTHVECDTFNTELYKGIPFLDVTTVYSKENGSVYINVINRHQNKVIAAEVINTSGSFKGKGEVSVVTAESLDEPFSIEKQAQYVPVIKQIETGKNRLTCSFPPHSFTQLKVTVVK